MDFYRREFWKFLDNKKSDEIEESSNDFSENLVHEPNLDSPEENENSPEDQVCDEDDEVEEEDEENTTEETCENKREDVEMEVLRENLYDEDDEDTEDVQETRHDDANFRYVVTESQQESGDSVVDQSWWTSDDDHDHSHTVYNDHDFLIFGHLDSPSSPSVEDEERDLLVLGHTPDHFLDIRDEDFFNVVSGDDVSSVTRGGTGLVQLEDSLGPFLEGVEDFYSGTIDTEYL